MLGRGALADTSEYVRLHVVAADDSAAAQALKLAVRDAVLDAARALLQDARDADAAWEIVVENRGVLASAAEACARANGYEGPVRCETGVYAFPDRQYGGAVVPAGDYRALRVVIGAGEGRNWWCVLYPSLCCPEAMEPEGPKFRSSVLDWLRGLFGGNAA